MYPTLPFGPISLPTGPFIALVALWLGVEIAARAGPRFGLHSDDIWNTGLLALAAGLIVARLWNVIQFWPIYVETPRLILSLRPSGYVLVPGLITALVAGYLYLLRKAMDPVSALAAFSIGAVAAAALINVGSFLTGSVVGMPSELPWALNHYGELLHPTALYRAMGLVLLAFALWRTRQPARPLHTLWLAGFGYSLVRLAADGSVADATLIGPVRASQLLALAAALLFALLLARETPAPATEAELETEKAAPSA